MLTIMKMPRLETALLPLLALALWLCAAPAAQAQKVGSSYHTDPANGFRFKPLKDFEGVPIPPDQRDSGLIGRLGGPTQVIKIASGGVANLDADMWIYALTNPEIAEAAEGQTVGKAKRPDVLDVLSRSLRGLDDVVTKPEVDEHLEIKSVDAHHRVYRPDAGQFEMIVDIWTFVLEHADISIVYVFSADKDKKWLSATKQSAKTFQLIDRVVPDELSATGQMSYDQLLEVAESEAARTEGWRAVPTPSKKFIILTSAKKKDFVNDVIKRLEKSREVFEEDFPPPPGFDAVSMVRLCGSEDEFHTYGGTSGGVAGWFNPGTTELVLYDAVNIDRNMSFAVMSHEAFHQYCHFLFGQSEAHRWFDEGHGDYYGGIEIKGSKAIITKQMPSGLDRLTVIREMVREGTYKPIEKHINYDHGQWQSQGPSNVSCYAQSWSIIYFLRQGTLKKVRGKEWKDEYANILPAYVETLSNGFKEAYKEILDKRKKNAEKDGRELTPEELDVSRRDLPPDAKGRIWKAAMEASWGKIDIEQFERDWLTYVEDDL